MNNEKDVQLFSERALAGRVVVVTGAGRGLGRTMAVALASAGANLVLVARNMEELNKTAEQTKGRGDGRSIIVKADVTSEADLKSLVDKAIAEFGKIDVLVNNAGLNGGNVRFDFEDIPLDQWENMIHTNVTGTFLATQVIGRKMLEQGYGKVINISSARAARSMPKGLCYSVSKAAIVQMTRALALEWGKRGVTVNCIAPGSLEADTPGPAATTDKAREARMAVIPAGRFGNFEEIASALVYLSSSAADYITGATLFVDGGIAAG